MKELKEGQIWTGGCVVRIYENPWRFSFEEESSRYSINDVDGFTRHLNQSFKLSEASNVSLILSHYEA